MPKTNNDGFLLDDSELNPYTVDGLASEENPVNDNKDKDQKDDKSNRGS